MVNKQFIAQNRPRKPAADMSVSLSGSRWITRSCRPAACSGTQRVLIYDINILGQFSFKGTTRDAARQEPHARIAECTAA